MPDILYFQASFAWRIVTAVVDYQVYLTQSLVAVTQSCANPIKKTSHLNTRLVKFEAMQTITCHCNDGTKVLPQ